MGKVVVIKSLEIKSQIKNQSHYNLQPIISDLHHCYKIFVGFGCWRQAFAGLPRSSCRERVVQWKGFGAQQKPPSCSLSIFLLLAGRGEASPFVRSRIDSLFFLLFSSFVFFYLIFLIPLPFLSLFLSSCHSSPESSSCWLEIRDLARPLALLPQYYL